MSDDSRKLKLMYFNIAGKAEAIRLICAYAGLTLDDHRFKDRSEFAAMKESGELQFGQVPALAVDGGKSQLVQSAAILRFLGKIANPELELYPQDAVVAAHVDAVLDQEGDAFMGFRVARYKERFGFSTDVLTEEVTKKVTAKINAETIPRHLGHLERMLTSGGTGWLAGTPNPTIADFQWVITLNSLQTDGGWTGKPDILDGFPGLKTLIDRFYAVPAIKQYYDAKKLLLRFDERL